MATLRYNLLTKKSVCVHNHLDTFHWSAVWIYMQSHLRFLHSQPCHHMPSLLK